MTEWRRQLSLLLVLALFFFAGVILGQVFSGRIPDDTGGELARYLTDFLKVGEGDHGPSPLAELLLAFSRRGIGFYYECGH